MRGNTELADPAEPSQRESHLSPLSEEQWLSRGRSVIESEVLALQKLRGQLDSRFAAAVRKLLSCRGKVVATGIGKAGIIAQKFSASLSSTGTPSHFLHPADAIHGDLGAICPSDVVVIYSYSGETEEVIRLVSLINSRGVSLMGSQGASLIDGRGQKAKPPITIAITGEVESTLARSCDLAIPLGKHAEACSLGLAPSTSTTLMLALSDALTLVVSEAKAFTREQFGDFHPGGSLGKQLLRTTEVMRPLEECRVSSDSLTIRDVFVRMSRPGRRSGAIMLTDSNGRLSGIFTDSDLARILEQQKDDLLDRPVAEVMTRQFRTIDSKSFMPEAVDLMAEFKISELPVIDEVRRPMGMIDITDVVHGSKQLRSSPADTSVKSQVVSIVPLQKKAS